MPMALMAVKIEDEVSILMNEFFDYNGSCYALSASRADHTRECAALEDFYDCTIQTEAVDDVPVIFVLEGQVIGWYKKARVYRNLQIVSVFMEGNIRTRVLDAVLLPKAKRLSGTDFHFQSGMYEIIEDDDERYDEWMKKMARTPKGLPLKFEVVDSFYSQDKLRLLCPGKKEKVSQENVRLARRDYCMDRCSYYAKRLMEDQCLDIREPKTMLMYARQGLIYDTKSADALYYEAMACEQLGFVKDGLRAIARALAFEPEADDMLALKGHLLFAKKDYVAAAECYEAAWQSDPLDGYLIYLGQAWFAMGNVDAAYKAYKRIEDKELLNQRGINLKDMERRWPFVALRGLFGKHKK